MSETTSDYSDTSATSNDAGDTYAQIVVPSYDLENPITPAASGGTTTGSSFIRLGSFPSLADTSDQPSGFANSLKLAQLVGGTAPTYPSTTAALASNLGETADDASPAALLSGNEYQGDGCYLLGFTDDTRYRGSGDGLSPPDIWVDWCDVDNTVANRQAETNRLLFKGGWWDHCDGNRVSTTSGDKVEVIQGNYKLVVLGRQEPSSTTGNAATLDMSGGHCVDQDAAPNASVMCVEYVQNDGIWTVFEDNGSGNLTERFHGQHKELFTGSLKESYTGSSPGSYDGNLTKLPDGDDDPVIVDKTWAKSISTYVGSDGKPVPTIYSWTGAGEINEVKVAGAVTSTTTALAITETTLGIKTDIVIGTATDIVLGLATEVVAGIKIDVDLERIMVAVDAVNLSGARTNIHAARNTVSAAYSVLTAAFTRAAGAVTRLAGTETNVAGAATQVATERTSISAVVEQIISEMTIIV